MWISRQANNKKGVKQEKELLYSFMVANNSNLSSNILSKELIK